MRGGVCSLSWLRASTPLSAALRRCGRRRNAVVVRRGLRATLTASNAAHGTLHRASTRYSDGRLGGGVRGGVACGVVVGIPSTHNGQAAALRAAQDTQLSWAQQRGACPLRRGGCGGAASALGVQGGVARRPGCGPVLNKESARVVPSAVLLGLSVKRFGSGG